VLEDCEITSESSVCISINNHANPTLRRNVIRAGTSGILVFDHGQGVIEENVISDCSHSGIEIRSHANPLVRRNTIRACAQFGVIASDGGNGTFEYVAATAIEVQLLCGAK
jgi:parallel beta-helix repeat protein